MQVLLVVILRIVKFISWDNLGGDFPLLCFIERSLVGVPRCFSYSLLIRIIVIYPRSVLGSYIIALSHALSWVVTLPEKTEQFFVGHFIRVVYHSYNFIVACPTTADFLVRWILGQSR